MLETRSADGTVIAYDPVGEGPGVVIVGGAFSTADAGRPLAGALAGAGFTGIVMDRRARGGSGDTAPYEPSREAEDLAAVIDAAGGVAGTIGHSSGAILVLLAASLGVPVGHAFLSEPPFSFGTGGHSADLPERLQALVDEGRGADAVSTFQRDGVGLPEPVVQQIRLSPGFPALEAVAQSTVYDATIARLLATPTPEMLDVRVPVTIFRGDPTFPMLVAAADRLAEAMPAARLVIVPESHDHGVDPAGTTREIALRLR